MDMVLEFFTHGAGGTLAAVALTAMRVTCGVFFAISGFHKLFHKGRHQTMLETLQGLGIPFPRFNVWWVAGVEFCAGSALVVGFCTPIAALGLLTICLVACATDGKQRVASWNPLNWADRVDTWLYLPETVYATKLAALVLIGAGPWSVDALLHGAALV